MSKKLDLVTNTVRNITNTANNRDEMSRNIQMFIDNDYDANGSDPLTDEELIAQADTADLTYTKFVQAKAYSDAFEVFLAANGRAMEKILNELRTVIK